MVSFSGHTEFRHTVSRYTARDHNFYGMLRDTNGRDLISGCSHSCILSVRLWIHSMTDSSVHNVFSEVPLRVGLRSQYPSIWTVNAKANRSRRSFGQKWFDFQFASDSAPSSGLQIILNRLNRKWFSSDSGILCFYFKPIRHFLTEGTDSSFH